MIEDQDDVALLPPSPRGDRNCCALTTTQTWLLTLEMPSVALCYSRFTRRCSFVGSPRRFHRVLAQFRTGGGEGARARSVSVADLEGRVPAPEDPTIWRLAELRAGRRRP